MHGNLNLNQGSTLHDYRPQHLGGLSVASVPSLLGYQNLEGEKTKDLKNNNNNNNKVQLNSEIFGINGR